jgi:hypothetical protein
MPPQLLPSISLVDVVPDDRRCVCRLMGTAEVQVHGFDPTGKSVLQGFLAPDVDDALGCYDKVVAMRSPLVDPVPFQAADGRYVSEETIFLPLSEDGVNVNRIMVFALPEISTVRPRQWSWNSDLRPFPQRRLRLRFASGLLADGVGGAKLSPMPLGYRKRRTAPETDRKGGDQQRLAMSWRPSTLRKRPSLHRRHTSRRTQYGVCLP